MGVKLRARVPAHSPTDRSSRTGLRSHVWPGGRSAQKPRRLYTVIAEYGSRLSNYQVMLARSWESLTEAGLLQGGCRCDVLRVCTWHLVEIKRDQSLFRGSPRQWLSGGGVPLAFTPELCARPPPPPRPEADGGSFYSLFNDA